MNAEPEFLLLEDVLLLHEEQLARFGGASGVRDMGLLESAVAMPQSTFDGEFLHADLYTMAAAYAFHIAENQPFVDGNKRTGLAAALVFLDLNGIRIQDPEMLLYDAMMSIADHRMSKDGMASVLRRLAVAPE
jgi:death on curing protein